MGSHKTKASGSTSTITRAISPIAKPLFEGKLLERSLKLVTQSAAYESGAGKQQKPRVKVIRRGVVEVTKALRKGQKGLVFFASDVHPIDIISHLPVLCENRGVVYGYLCDRLALGKACASTRPSAVIMIAIDDAKPVPGADDKLLDLYRKVAEAAKTANPFFD